MRLTFFADHCVPRFIIDSLRSEGFEVLKLRDHIPPESLNEVVIETAQELNAILISLNGDFSDIVRYPPENYKGIISLQIRNHPEIIPEIINTLKQYLRSKQDSKYYKGKLLRVDAYRIRVRG